MSLSEHLNLPLAVVAFGLLSCGQVSRGAESRRAAPPQVAEAGVELPSLPPVELEVSGPFRHDNLEIFLIHGDDRLVGGREILTLEEALERKDAVVHETEDVNNLAIENLSAGADVFVQAGDIVKGGKQDRTIGVSLLVSPGSGRVPLAAFCVEQGRWGGRGSDVVAEANVGTFSLSTNAISSLELKTAVNATAQQKEVWDEVAEYQSDLALACGSVRLPSTSLQLTLEVGELRDASADYVEALADAVEDEDKAVGFAFAINGAVNSAEVYGSHELFLKMWPKGLEACVAEAVVKQAEADNDPVEMEDVRALVAECEERPTSTQELTERIERVSYESGERFVFETRDRELAGAWVHRSYLARKGGD